MRLVHMRHAAAAWLEKSFECKQKAMNKQKGLPS
jgi:hypothetical protein